MVGGRSAWWAALVVASVAVAGCGNAPAEPLLAAAPSVADLPPGLLDELAEQAAGALPAVAERLPAADAEAIGRPGGPDSFVGAITADDPTASGTPVSPGSSDVTWSSDNSITVGDGAFGDGTVAAPPVSAPPGSPIEDPSAVAQPGGGISGQRVLDAVAPVLAGLPLDAPAELVPFVRVPPSPDGAYAVFETVGEDPTVTALGRLRTFGPDVIGWITALTGTLAEHPRVAPLLRVGAGTEPEIATAHGRAHLALAVVVAGIVVPAADVPLAEAGPEVVVGAGVEAAAAVLRSRPMPAAYPAAQLERRRAEYRFPRNASGRVQVRDHRFGLGEGPLPGPGEPANGLVTAVPGGLVVRTGTPDGAVEVSVHVLAQPPTAADENPREVAGWHEIVEIGFTADAGAASVTGADAAGGVLAELTPPWPGPMRARVSARGRDDGDDERYDITVWAAPPAPDVIIKATDRLGHRLRGEPEPPVVERPESAYRWLRDSSLAYGATVTVVTGSSAEQVIAAFGGDPAQPVPRDEALTAGLEPYVAVLPVDGAVLAVEPNGWQGSSEAVLRAVSARGRAASMYWSGGDALTNLAFARDGTVVDSFEPLFEHVAADPEVRDALAGIDWVDYHDLHEKGLVAVERFVGRGIGPHDVERIDASGVAYRIPESG